MIQDNPDKMIAIVNAILLKKTIAITKKINARRLKHPTPLASS